jgi:hypothetical protein
MRPVRNWGRDPREYAGLGVELLAAAVLCLAISTPAQAAVSLRTVVEDVPGSAGYRYGARDNLGNSLDGLKVVKSPLGGYLGVYYTVAASRYTVNVATSADLLTWRFQRSLAVNASQPTIHNLATGASVVAYESHVGCGGGGKCVGLRYYTTVSALLSGVASRSIILPRTLSACAEGTPNVYSATADLSSIDLGLHYSRGCNVDRQARGTLTGFNPTTWSPSATPSVDNAIFAAGASAAGDIRDRDGNAYDGAYHRLYDGQLGAVAAWRTFLMTGGTMTQLAIRTHGGSRGFSKPTFTPLELPNGQPGVVVTQFVTGSGAAPGEVGQLIYYRATPSSDPEIAAAGDISCASTSCHDDETSNLLVSNRPTRVLTLGDNQYDRGELANFQTYYEPDWGRVKSITMPTPGNHDPPSSGYGPYFGKPANYSFDLGKWHMIALDSTGVQAATAFLQTDLLGRTNRCILAYWHHPRFSSDTTHGSSTLTAPFWDRLYAAGADVVLVGHAHTYERFAPQTPAAQPSPAGIRQFVVGTGGRSLYSFGTARANSEVRISGRYGVLRMTLHPTSYEWRFQGEDGGTYDSGSSTCS